MSDDGHTIPSALPDAMPEAAPETAPEAAPETTAPERPAPAPAPAAPVGALEERLAGLTARLALVEAALLASLAARQPEQREADAIERIVTTIDQAGEPAGYGGYRIQAQARFAAE